MNGKYILIIAMCFIIGIIAIAHGAVSFAHADTALNASGCLAEMFSGSFLIASAYFELKELW